MFEISDWVLYRGYATPPIYAYVTGLVEGKDQSIVKLMNEWKTEKPIDNDRLTLANDYDIKEYEEMFMKDLIDLALLTKDFDWFMRLTSGKVVEH